MRIYFVRHGETEANALLRQQGPDEPLSTLGIEQARRLGERFSSLPVQKIFTSPYLRTMKTAEQIALVTHQTPEPLPLLKEFLWPSAWIGKGRGEPGIHPLRLQIEKNWIDAPTTKILDEETFVEVRERAIKTLSLLTSLSKTLESVAVVSHARFLKVVVAVLIHGPDVDGKTAHGVLYGISLSNTGLTVADYDATRTYPWNLVTINDHVHLGDYHPKRI